MSRWITPVCGIVVCTIGAIAFTGWVIGDPALVSVWSGTISIKTNTALALFALGLALLLLGAESPGPAATLVGRLLASIAGIVGVLTLSQHVIGWDLGIDQFLFRESAGAPATASPNRMGPPASVSLPLLALALLLLDYRTARERAPSQPLALLVIAIALMPLLGYLFNATQMYGVARYTGIALHTAIAFILLALGVLFARRDAGVMRRLTSEDSAGVMLRRLVPAAVVVPIVLGVFRTRGEDLGWYDAAFGRTLLVLSVIVVFSAIVWATSSVVERQTAARARAEAAEREVRQQLLATIESERSARALAEKSMRVKDEFLATVTHELRSPLSAILGWAHLLGRGGLNDAQVRHGIEAIERNSRLQAQLIEDLLDMSRINTGTARLHLQEIDMVTVIDGAIDVALPSIRAKDITIERRFDAHVGHVLGDPARLHQIVSNLIGNAVKFTPAGGRITATLGRRDDLVQIQVIDTGIGIRPEFLPHVFERFVQADPSTTRSHGGLGLGLTIARQLTELHGGTLTAWSAGEGRGTTFTLRLPAAVARPAEAPADNPADAAAVPVGPISARALDGARVLLVDDQPDACAIFERVLQEHGAEVTAASSVDAAEAWLASRPFDILVSDISMPGRDGFELIRIAAERQPSLPAVAVTAFSRPEDRERIMAAGFQAYLAKPVAPDRLVVTVASIVRDRAAV